MLAGPMVAQGHRMTLADLGREVGLEHVRLTPDGKSAVLVTRRINYDDNRFERTLVLIDLASGSQRPLTPGRRNVTSPEFAPSGDRIAFLDNEEAKPAQLYVLPLGGGEARRITEGKHGVEGFAWRPDGSAIAYYVEDDAVERTGDEKHNRSFEVGDNVYLAQSAPLARQAWLVPADGGTPTRLTSGTRSVNDLVWLPDGKSLVLTTQVTAHSGERIHSSATVHDVTTGVERPLGEASSVFGSVALSPDGRFVARTRSKGPELGFRISEPTVTPIEGGEPKLVAPGLDRTMYGIKWLPDNSGLVLVGPDGTRQCAWVVPLGGQPRKLALGTIEPNSDLQLSRAGAAVFVGATPTHPSELYVLARLDAEPKQLTEFNTDLSRLDLGRVERIEWKGPDGFAEDGVLIYPPGYVKGQRYPLVLNIHGGPMGSSTEAWSAFDQLIAAEGWIEFRPNYRGSNNLGDAYQRAVVNDAGEGPGKDVMAGIAAVKALGAVDTTRIAVSGWSYGGYMTAWLTSHFGGWRAAMAGAAVTDWYDWYDMADMNVWAGYGLGGSPWLHDNAANYWRQSPMAYAHKIRTPTLILSTTGDPRVTVSQSYKLYHALKDNGVEVKFIAYPVGGHFPPDPVHQRDVYRRWIEWIKLHFGASASASGG
jgi:dipeptidyl aminopeptidase/acylaminoacyl peptidase